MESTKKRKRPIWVWVISIFYFLSAGYGLLSFYLINSGVVPLPPAQQSYIDSLSTFDYAITIVIGASNLLAAIALFQFRKHAFHLFSGALCGSVLLTIFHSITKGWFAAIENSGLNGMIIGWGIALAVIFYSKKLINRGILT